MEKCFTTYPDSVSRVNPPNTTIPKTLAALPSNQYATILLDVSGNLDTFAGSPSITLRHAEVVNGDDTDFSTDGPPTCLMEGLLKPDRSEFWKGSHESDRRV